MRKIKRKEMSANVGENRDNEIRNRFPIIRYSEDNTPAWGPGPPNQWVIDILSERPVYDDDPTLPPLCRENYNPKTHSATGTPFARPWDEQDEAELLARQVANTRKLMRSVLNQIKK